MITADQAVGVAKKYNTGSTGKSSFTTPPPPTVARAPSSNIKQGLINTSTPQFQNIARVAKGGLGKVGDALNAPSFYTEKLLTGGKGYEETLKNKNVVNATKFVNPVLGKALETPAGRGITSFSARMIADPLNLVGAGLGKVLKLPEVGRKIVQGASKLINANRDRQIVGKVIQGASKVKDFVGNKIVYGYKAPEKFMKQYDGLQTSLTGRNVEKAAEVAKPLYYGKSGEVLDALTQKKLGDVFRVLTGQSDRALTADELKFINSNKAIVDKTLKTFEDLANKQTKLGVPESTFSNLKGEYFGKRIFSTKIGEKPAQPFMKSGGLGLDESVYKKRMNLSDEALENLGEIKEPAYGAATAALTEMNNIDKLKFFRKASRFVVKEGGEVLPKSTRYGVLSGQRVPKEVAQYIRAVAEPVKNNAYTKATAMFKRGKVIYSPKQLLRNTVASQVQAYLNPSGRADSIRRIPEAIRELKNKGKYYQEAKNMGIIGKTMASSELGKFAPDALQKFSKKQNPLYKAGSFIQNSNEEMVKLQVFINERKAGKTVRAAAKAAEETGFDYQKVTPFVSKMRRGEFGPLSMPFLTYPIKAAALTGKTLVKKPVRLANIVKAEKTVENMSRDEAPDEQYLPDYLKQSVRLPAKNKASGNPYYLNAKYLYPYGGFGDMPSIDPIASEGYSQIFNKDSFTKQDVQTIPGGAGVAQRVEHAAETFLPTPYRSGSKLVKAAFTNPRYSTAPTVGQAIVQELGLPLYQYNEAEGASFDGYRRKEEMRNAKNQMRKTLDAIDGRVPENVYGAVENYYLNEMDKISR